MLDRMYVSKNVYKYAGNLLNMGIKWGKIFFNFFENEVNLITLKLLRYKVCPESIMRLIP